MTLVPEFLDLPGCEIVALSGDFTVATRHKIPALWQDFWSRKWCFDGIEESAAYGISYAMCPDGRFSYAAGRYITPPPETLPLGACRLTLSAGRYAVFRDQGPVTDIPKLFDAIFMQWLPTSGEVQREGPVFERYPYHADASPEFMRYEVWLPVTG